MTNNEQATQPAKELRALQTIIGIAAPSEMANSLSEFIRLVNAAKTANNVPAYYPDGTKESDIFRYLVAFKQCYLVRGIEKEARQGNRRFHKVFKPVETVARPSKAKEDDVNFLPVLNDDNKEAIMFADNEGKKHEVFETVVEWKFAGWKEIRIVRANYEQPTEKIHLIVFDAVKGLNEKSIMLYAIDALAKKQENALVSEKTLVRMSSEIHAFIPENSSKGEQVKIAVDTMKTGGGVPARFLSKDLSKFCDLFLRKVERAMSEQNALLPAVSAKMKK